MEKPKWRAIPARISTSLSLFRTYDAEIESAQLQTALGFGCRPKLLGGGSLGERMSFGERATFEGGHYFTSQTEMRVNKSGEQIIASHCNQRCQRARRISALKRMAHRFQELGESI